MGVVPGYDSQLDMGASYLTLRWPWPNALYETNMPSLGYVYSYPILHVLVILAAEISGLSLTSIALILPPVLVAVTVVVEYLIVVTISPDSRVALLSTIAFTFVLGLISSAYNRQTIGVLFLVFALWIGLGFARSRSSNRMAIPFALLVPILGLSHSFCAFASIALLLSLAILWIMLPPSGTHSVATRSSERLRHVPLLCSGFVLLIIWFLLLVFVDISPLSAILQSLSAAQTEGFAKAAHTLIPWQTYVTLLGNGLLILFTIVTALFGLYKNAIRFMKSVILLASFWSLALVSGIFLLNRIGSAPLTLPRIFLFTWILLVPLLLLSVGRMTTKRHPSTSKMVGLAVVLTFVVLGLLGVPQYYYDKTATPDYSSGEFNYFLNTQDYHLTSLSPLHGKIIGDQGMQELLAGYWQVDVEVNVRAFGGDDQPLRQSDWFIVRSEDFRLVWSRAAPISERNESIGNMTTEYFNYLATSPTLEVVYDSGNVWVFKVS